MPAVLSEDEKEYARKLWEPGNEAELEAKCEELFELRKRLEEESKTDKLKTPIPTLLADGMRLPVEALLELLEFLDTEFADWKEQRIRDRMQYTMGSDGVLRNPLTNDPVV